MSSPGAGYRLYVVRKPATVRQENVRAGSERVELVFPRLGRVRLRPADADTGETIAVAASELRGVAWRASGSEVYTRVPSPQGTDGVIELEVPGEPIDVSLFLNRDGYRPEQVLGIPVSALATDAPAFEIPLQRGSGCKLKLIGDFPPQSRTAGFSSCSTRISSAPCAGRSRTSGYPSNHRVNGVNMWVGDPGLLEQMPEFDPAGTAFLRGLKPGRHALRAFPADLTFEPATFDLEADGVSPVAVELRRRPR